jgi:quinol-cytochrome oxidoreductase complex cytochrome b subunit
VKTILEFIAFALCPFVIDYIENKSIHSFKKVWYKGLLGIVFVLGFQCISVVTRNVGIKITHDSFLVTSILMFDYYIMIALYHLYNKEKGEK